MGDALLGLAAGFTIGVIASFITWLGLGGRSQRLRDALARIGDNPHDDNGQP